MSQQVTEPSAPTITYPFDAPEPGQRIEVAPGVHWIRLPLPFRLDHINVWALQDEDGWSLVDTGIRTPQTVQAWETLTADGPLSAPLHRVLVTHMHPDHIGLAGWFTRRSGATLHISRLEYLMCRSLTGDTGREPPPDALRFYREAGWGEAALEAYAARFGSFGNHIYALPDSFRRLSDGQRLRIGRHEWEVVIGAGHSPEHACLYCAELKLFISGDQVLPRISSNVSVQPLEPEANPMRDWLDSLDRIRRRVPDDVLVLPSHNKCFRGLHERIDALLQGQHEALQRLHAALATPARAVDVFKALFKRDIPQTDASQLGMATGEAVACLNHLLAQGRIQAELRDGVRWYRAA